MAKGTDKSIKHGTVIMPCNCKHEYQDEKYGIGRRVFNKCSGFNARCTVCGKTKTASGGSF